MTRPPFLRPNVPMLLGVLSEPDADAMTLSLLEPAVG